MCRDVAGDCDVPEYCNGDDSFCPTDVYKRDGTNCTVDGVRLNLMYLYSSSSHMRVMNHKLVREETVSSSAECSRDKQPFSFVRELDSTSSESRHKDTDHYKSPFPSAGTARSLFSAKTVQQRPLLPREVKTWLPDCGVAH